MEILCVYIFDGPRKHMDSLEQLIDVGNNPAIRTEANADSGKHKTSNRKEATSKDCS